MSYVGNTNTTQAFTPAIDYFSGNGSTVAFTLSRPVASVAQVQVVVNNVAQNPSTAFTVSGNTITFTGAPSSGTNNIYVQYTSPITQVIAPGQGTVAPASLSQGGPSWDTSGNVTLTGSIALNNGAADGAQLTLSSSGYSDWNWDNYSGRLRAYYGSTEYFTINSSGNVGIGTSSPTNISGYTGLAINNGTNGSLIDLRAGGTLYSRWVATSSQAAISTEAAIPLVFQTNATERARIDSSGNLLVNTTSSYGGKVNILHNTAGDNALVLRTSTTTYNAASQLFQNSSGGNAGYIQITGASSVSYVTTSDYRLKENIAPMTGALEKIVALKPCTYTWKEDGISTQGFIAHELQAVVPECVVGEKDAVDEDGNPVYQGIDTSFLVATLTAAIQELKAELDAAKADIAALKGQ